MDDGRVVVAIKGELDIATAEKLRECLSELVEQRHHHVVVDMAGLGFIDSTGVGVLVSALKQLREEQGELALASPPPQARKVLEISGLAGVFPVVPA